MSDPTLFERRWCCRRFAAEPLPRTTLNELLDAARWAPSGGNLQPWRFVVARSPERRRRLAAAAFGQAFVAEAPVVVVVCALPEVSAGEYGERGRTLYCLQDTAAAVENLLLRAAELGLGACWVGAFDEDEASRALDLPQSWRPVAMIPVGRPSGPPPARSRLPLDRVVLWLDGDDQG